MLRVKSTLPDETEALISKVLGGAIAVHTALGPGYPEKAYGRAMVLELEAQGLTYEREKPIQVTYRDKVVCNFKLDLVIGGVVVVEIKCVDRLKGVHRSQLLGYMRATKLRAGLLLNFKVGAMPDGIKRVVL